MFVSQSRPPVRLTPFVGRERDIAELRSLLRTARLVTLTGAGGIGKTRLAARVAEEMGPDLPDGARFADLSGCSSASETIGGVAHALGLADEPEQLSQERITAVLRTQRVLLILDTCERAVEPTARLCQGLLARCPDLRILATSQESLRIAEETVWRVPPLSLPPDRPAPGASRGTDQELPDFEAIRLFLNRAREVRADFAATPEELETVAEICTLLDGVPLAIELAAARVKVLSLPQIRQRLDDRFRLLVTTERDVPARQRTLRTAVEWSYDSLSAAERVLLRRLAIFSGWTLDLAENVCAFGEVHRAEILDLHTSLMDKSLVVYDSETDREARYRLHDTIRAYAGETLAAGGEAEECFRRFLDFAVDWLEGSVAAMSGDMDWESRLSLVHRLDQARENLAALLAWALRAGRIHDGLRACVALRPYWLMRGSYLEGRDRLRGFLGADLSGAADPLKATALTLYAELVVGVDGPAAASAPAEQALNLARSAGSSRAEALALGACATVALRAGDDTYARQCATAMLALVRAAEGAALREHGLSVLATLAARRGDHAEARRRSRAILDSAAARGDRWVTARCNVRLGILAIQRGDLEAAAADLRAAPEVFEQVGSASDTAHVQSALGRLALAGGDILAARERLAESLRLGLSSGHRLVAARTLEALAELASTEGEPRRVAVLGGAAEALRASLAPGHSSRLRSRAEEGLGVSSAAEAWEEGARLSLEEVVAVATSFGPAPAPRGGAPSQELTPRERQIADLVGDGLSNRAIAERLSITPATVARHIANIFAKLEFTSRSRLASWAVRTGGEELHDHVATPQTPGWTR